MNVPPSATSTAWAVIRMTGKDSLDILHRTSTQSLADISPGEARATLFCDFRGRLLHRAWVVVAPDDAVWLLRDDGPGMPLLEYIDEHVFREDVQLEDVSSARRVIGVPFDTWDNPYSLENRAGATHLDGDVPAAVVDAHGFVLLVSPPAQDVEAASERAHVLAGRPRQDHEISDAFNPYEVGLARDVHLSKGCYTGQEVMQRLLTFDSVKRQLSRVSGDGAAPDVGDDLLAEGNKVGVVTTSLAHGTGWLGLAAIRIDSMWAPVTLDDGRRVRMEPLDPGKPLGRP
jgi:folate-binding protein YgfZ